MSLKVNQEQEEEIIANSQALINRSVEKRNDKVDTSPLITSKIGKGEDAKNSIIWIIITWCLAIPAGITILYFITMWVILFHTPQFEPHIEAIRDHIIKIWSLFSPIITLALGYLYGRSSKDEEKSP